MCGLGATAARITVTTWPSAARVVFVPPQDLRSPLSASCLLFATWSLCDVVAACRVRSCASEYTLTGVWVSETQTWTLSPGAWLTNPCDYDMAGFSGTVDVVAGLRRFSGSVTEAPGCTTFSLMELIPTGAPVLSPFCTSSGTTAFDRTFIRMARHYKPFGAAAPTPVPTNLGDTKPPTGTPTALNPPTPALPTSAPTTATPAVAMLSHMTRPIASYARLAHAQL
jgi:hypothetical protein